MLVTINPDNIDDRIIKQAVNSLKNGGVIIFPTDTVYAIGCDVLNKKGLAELTRIKGFKKNKAHFSIICSSLSDLSLYVKQIDRSTFKTLKQCLPGPFTFILKATNEVAKLFDSNKKEIGIRIPANPIILRIVEELGNPIATSSLHNEDDELMDYFVDPYVIYEQFDDQVDLIIDGGYGKLEASTIIDFTDVEPIVVRQGIGTLP
jgi:tRNA threonylcarbamoyl adenosine modification protein (Sua5/YciO/YrdC/YwlC family)